MPNVSFTQNLQRHLPAPSMTVVGASVRACLDAVFAEHDQLRGYVVDEHGAVRKHIVVFVNGRPIADRAQQSDGVMPDDEIYVMQALSGG